MTQQLNNNDKSFYNVCHFSQSKQQYFCRVVGGEGETLLYNMISENLEKYI